MNMNTKTETLKAKDLAHGFPRSPRETLVRQAGHKDVRLDTLLFLVKDRPDFRGARPSAISKKAFGSLATDNQSRRSKCHFEMADQQHGVQTAIRDQPWFTDLDHQSSRARHAQRAIHGHKSNFGCTAVLPVGVMNQGAGVRAGTYCGSKNYASFWGLNLALY
jgi:hypothetical protein